MQIRWLVKTFKYDTWNNKDDCYDSHTQYNDPILQFFDGKQWKNVPIVEVETK